MLEINQIAQQIIIPTPSVGGQGLTLAEIGRLISTVGSFLTAVGFGIAIVAVIVSGLMYMYAGSSPEAVKKAQTWFKNAVIGSFIILGFGVILNTLANVVSRQFFCTLEISIPFFQRCFF